MTIIEETLELLEEVESMVNDARGEEYPAGKSTLSVWCTIIEYTKM